MKSKLLLQNKAVIIAERYGDCVKIYFNDGHSEVVDEKIDNYFQKEKPRSKYKNPIEIYGQLLYPVKSQKDKECIWINLDCIDREDKVYISMLKSKNIFDKAIKMFLKHLEIELKNA